MAKAEQAPLDEPTITINVLLPSGAKAAIRKPYKKEWLENLVVQETMKLIHDDAVTKKDRSAGHGFSESGEHYDSALGKAAPRGGQETGQPDESNRGRLFTRTTKERLDALEAQKDELTAKIADEKLRKPSFNADFIRFWLMKFRKFDISQQKQRKALIEIL